MFKAQTDICSCTRRMKNIQQCNEKHTTICFLVPLKIRRTVVMKSRLVALRILSPTNVKGVSSQTKVEGASLKAFQIKIDFGLKFNLTRKMSGTVLV